MQKVLSILMSGGFHSGDEIGERLGVSRAAVWKKVKALQELGVPVDSVRGKGYRLPSSLELIDPDYIRQHARVAGLVLDCHLSLGSTNDAAMASARQGAGSGYHCLSEHQTGGRGRRGREWLSPFGANLYLSAVREFSQGAASLEGLSLVVGLALRKAITRVIEADLRLKWPNDLLWQGKKLAGILLEVSGDPAGLCKVVIGIGLNLSLSAEQRSQITQPVCDLNEIAGLRVSKNKLLVELITVLDDYLLRFSREGFAGFVAEWQSYDAFSGKLVDVHLTETNVQSGEYLGVDRSGGLLVKVGQERKCFNGGELSLRVQ